EHEAVPVRVGVRVDPEWHFARVFGVAHHGYSAQAISIIAAHSSSVVADSRAAAYADSLNSDMPAGSRDCRHWSQSQVDSWAVVAVVGLIGFTGFANCDSGIFASNPTSGLTIAAICSGDRNGNAAAIVALPVSSGICPV